jgi:hypothetical protein
VHFIFSSGLVGQGNGIVKDSEVLDCRSEMGGTNM